LHTKSIVLAALAAASLASASALATDDDTTTDSATAAAPSQRAYGVFRRPRTAGDALPARARQTLASLADREDVDLDDARAVAPAGAGYVWAIAGPTRICLAIPDPVDGFAVGCQDSEQAQTGRLWVGLNGLPGQDAGDVRLAFFAPDGVRSVQSVRTDGSRVPVPVSDNVAFADVTDSDAVEFTADGTTYATHVPGTPEVLTSTGD
jgi:hypothetical protein